MLYDHPSAQILAQLPSCNPDCRVCHYKNLDYSTQLKRKQKWAEKQLERWKSVLRDIRPAPEEERLAYRSKTWMRSYFENHRPEGLEILASEEGKVSFGMFRSKQVCGRWEKEFISWNTCPLHTHSIQQLIETLREILSKEAPDFLSQSLVGLWIGSPHLVIVSRNPDLEALKNLNWKQILVPPFDRVWFHWNQQVGRKVFGHRPIEPVFGKFDHTIHPIRAFRQVAGKLLIEARRQAVKALLGTGTEPGMVLDLYCGTGDLSLLLPPLIGWIGIELAQEAVRYANTLRPPGRPLHEAYTGTVEHRLLDPKVWNQVQAPYALYLNPPRSGLSEEARSKILNLMNEKPPMTVVYLSCSASSLARDLVGFEKKGYPIRLLQPYDFFPQTEHFETLAVLTTD